MSGDMGMGGMGQMGGGMGSMPAMGGAAGMGGGMPSGGGMDGMGGMGGLGGLGGAGGLGALMGGDPNNLGKAIGAAAQMGLIPNGNGGGGGGLSLPKFGNQRPVQQQRPMQAQVRKSQMPGAGMARSVNGAVNYGVKAGAYRAINNGLRKLRF